MVEISLRTNSLVVYKQKPARVLEVQAKKITIEIEGQENLKVRPKDVTVLHPGPLESLANLKTINGEVRTAWELLEGETVALRELAELIFNDFSVNAAWSTWQLILDGLYFRGTAEAVAVLTAAEVKKELADREAKEAQKNAWESFLERLSAGNTTSEDSPHMQDIVALAENQRDTSRVLQALGQTETPENAHALLLKSGYWDIYKNPYPARAGLPTKSSTAPLRDLPEETRLDLTHLISLAIDDADSSDPDDAISWDGEKIWVHIADVSAVVTPDSPADLEAQSRGANLYLPDGTVTMLPIEATNTLALGLKDISPALSFGMCVDQSGSISDLEIVPSWVSVTRMSYLEAEEVLSQEPLQSLSKVTDYFQKKRVENGAIELDLPELKIRVIDGRVTLKPVLPLKSRHIVREAMLMVGEAVAHFALENSIPIAYATQDPPGDELPAGDSLSTMFGIRKMLKPGQPSALPSAHAGLGLGLYVQTTSPLRRYLDLVAHQQLRAFLDGQKPLDQQQLMQRIGAANAVSRDVRRAERLSNKHWTLIYLTQVENWEGIGTVVEIYGKRHVILIPELGLETSIYQSPELPLDSQVPLKFMDLDLPYLEAQFQ